MRKDTDPGKGRGARRALPPGQRLRIWCTEHHGSMRKAAPALGMSPTLLSFFCNAKKLPSKERNEQLIAQTGIDFRGAP